MPMGMLARPHSFLPCPHCTYISSLPPPAPQARLDFLYSWAVEGPPLVMPLGMLARPQTFLTALLQLHAQRMAVHVGGLALDCVVLAESDTGLSREAQLVVSQTAEGGSTTSPAPSPTGRLPRYSLTGGGTPATTNITPCWSIGSSVGALTPALMERVYVHAGDQQSTGVGGHVAGVSLADVLRGGTLLSGVVMQVRLTWNRGGERGEGGAAREERCCEEAHCSVGWSCG